jgi:hypothetical protein
MSQRAWDWPHGPAAGARGRRRLRQGGLPPWRPLERWADGAEAFPGAAAFEDVAELGAVLPAADGRPEAAEETLAGAAQAAAARLAVVQLALAAGRGFTAPDELEGGRAAAAAYVRSAELSPAESAALVAAIRLAGAEDVPVVASALCAAGAAAASGGPVGGATSLFRAAYRLAAARGWSAQAALAAAGMEGLARAGGARRSALLWSRRAARHARRAADLGAIVGVASFGS